MEEQEQTPKPKREQEQKITIDLTKYKALRDIIDNKRSMFRIILTILILVVTIFTALAFVVISLKQLYPYNNIRINTLGATTMEDEDKEITYWLFNTAELWANSGIKVKKGDVITIRASGKSHTAIHHLYDGANSNQKLSEPWTGTEGILQIPTDRDKARANYRLWKDKPQEALIMQVIPDGIDMSNTDTLYKLRLPYLRRDKYRYDRDLSCWDKLRDVFNKNTDENDNIYFIGKEREQLRINQDGVMHFAVNDIVLTDSTIHAMKKDDNFDIMKFEKRDDGKTELDYYEENKYYNTWYDDNVGSFLIIVERNK